MSPARERAQSPAFCTAHAHLNTLVELLQAKSPKQALARFSAQLSSSNLDVVSANALSYVSFPVSNPYPSTLIQRANETKKNINLCVKQLGEFATPKFKDKRIIAHPLGSLGARFLHNSKRISYFRASSSALKELPASRLQSMHPLQASTALDNADFVVFEPKTITSNGIIVPLAGRILAELALSRGIPSYAIATSWHVSKSRQPGREEEHVSQAMLAGILSEHGIYNHEEFLRKAEKLFPWLA
jgi:translation initiation factor 2B subunit (eIF-2B alpha/beta/delta family)